ncbi:MAG: hypothetical protein ACE5DI_00270 [Candidatus Micrarchaeia archaeon]
MEEPEPAKQTPMQTTQEKKKTRKKKSSKLTRFDEDLLALVKQGKNTQFELLTQLMIDPSEFTERIGVLTKQKLLVRDAIDANIIRLGIEGYNHLRQLEDKREKKARKKTTVTPTAPTQNLQPPVIRTLPQKHSEEKIGLLPSEAIEKNAFTMGLDSDKIPAKQTTQKKEKAIQSNGIPLEELLEKYGPTKQLKAFGGAKAVKQLVEDSQTGTCELCKAPFKLSVNASESRPKYGHCFCGAAYHKDCYESLAHENSQCIRCGKNLKISLDKKSEEAVKTIKKLFD